MIAALLAASLAVSPYRIDPVIDGALTLGPAALIGLEEGVVKPTLAGGISCSERTPTGRCDPAQLSWPDRTVVGNDSAGWRAASDVGVGLALALPLAADGLDALAGGEPFRDWASDVVVMAETVAIANLSTDVMKLAVRRPRPTQYREGAYVGSVEHQLSFPSGHATAVSSATTAYAVTFALRHPTSPWRWAVYGGAAALTALTAYGRVAGGMHFYSDVAAGALVGVTVGLVVPLAHRSAVAVSPVALGGGRGLAVTFAL